MFLPMEELLINLIISMSILLAGLSVFYRKKLNRQEKVFSYFLIVGAIFEQMAWISISAFHLKNNLPLLHLYTLLEFVLIYMFAAVSIKGFNGLFAKIVIIAGSSFVIGNSIWIQSIYTFNSISITVVKVFTIVVSIIFFYKVLSTQRYSISETRPTVYFFTAIFLNACTSIIWYMYSNELLLIEKVAWKQLLILKNVSALAASIIILLGLYYAIIRKENDII